MPKKKTSNFQVWKTDGQYIQGKKVARTTKDIKVALKRAKALDRFNKVVRGDSKDVQYWIEDKEGTPIGLIENIQ